MVKYKLLSPYAVPPRYATPGAAGADLSTIDDILLDPVRGLVPEPVVKLVRCGLAIEIPEGFEGQIRPRSGLSKRGVIIPNAPGTIDSDYRGEICVLMANLTRKYIRLERGDRIAQLVIAPVVRMGFCEAAGFSETDRGDGGFGSTGKK